jgi:galactokinase
MKIPDHTARRIAVSTPGRICLFGEHQDYLMLPVIPAAISLRMTIEGTPRNDPQVRIDLPDVGGVEKFSFNHPLTYRKPADYFRSAAVVLRRHGAALSRGFEGVVKSSIPIRAGTSSSSALAVSWVHLLSLLDELDPPLSPEQIARLAHEAEVLEFHEAGGMMDQYSTALGGIIAIDFRPTLGIERIECDPGTFVLGDSLEPKDTQVILSRVKQRVLDIVARLRERRPGFSLLDATGEDAAGPVVSLTPKERLLLAGTIRNHEITRAARRLLAGKPLDRRRVGTLLTEHQAILRDVLGISTPKIDRMIDAAMRAGAYGGKINGSGGGGCMFAYAPEHPEAVAEAITREGGRAYVVTVDKGTTAWTEP